MATPPNGLFREMTGSFRFDVGFLKAAPRNLKQKVKRYSPHCDVIAFGRRQLITSREDPVQQQK
jgi:hypothetical protein